jgi:hypothetical protein
MISFGTRGLLILVAAVFIAPFTQTAAADHTPTLVEVWKGGDDGLTNKLSDTIETAFRSASDFHLSNGKMPGTLMVTIPSNVRWKKVGQRTKVFYDVKFSSVDGRDIGASKGSCWDDSFGTCATRIVKDARIVSRKMSIEKTR